MNARISVGVTPEGRITVSFPYNPDYISKVKTISGYSWHSEKKYWSFPFDGAVFEQILSVFEGTKIDVDPTVYLEPMRKELVSRKYSPKTIKAYLHHNEKFLRYTGKAPDEIGDDEIKAYLVHLVENGEVATSTLNNTISALKFYYGTVRKQEFAYDIERPRKDQKLPVVLSKEEVAQILSSVANLRHKALLMLVYSAGLRVSEVVGLKPTDIDAERKLIHVRDAKGRKDRYTLLSAVAMDTLNLYMKSHQPREWLFPSRKANSHITTRTVQKVFEQARKKAGIKKDVTVHSLRHSFATHLLESGVDIRYIQELLGHKSSKTTEIYTHVSNRDLSKIRNPLDSILSKEPREKDD